MRKINRCHANVVSIFLMAIIILSVTTVVMTLISVEATSLAYSCEVLESLYSLEVSSPQQPQPPPPPSLSELVALPKYVKSWGGFGTAPGQFQEPSSIEVSSEGDIYVAGHEDRIQVFTNDGQLKFTFGKSGSGDGEFQHPHGLAMNRKGGEDVLYAGDQENHRIQVFNANCSFTSKLANPGLQHIHDIGIDPNNGDIYAPDYELGHLQKLSSTGSVIWIKTGFPQAWGVSVDSGGFMYLAATGNNSLLKLDPLDGNTLKMVSGFNKITGVYVDRHDLVYAVDAINKNIKIYDTELNLKAIWDLSTIIGGLEIEPEDITISPDDKRIYLAEVNKHTVVYMERD
jgi:DNA-binding beta-propeller fold protein YncE